MSNIITFELSAEDRARLDKLTAALLTRTEQVENYLAGNYDEGTPVEAPKTPTETTEADTPQTTPAEEEKPTAPAEQSQAEALEPKEEKPAVTLEQIQQKVVQLAAGFGGTKKTQVREIINAHAKKVSDLPADKWTEVWEQLTALESEG